MIDISKYDKANVLATLYNNAKTQGMGILQYEPGDMTIDEAHRILEEGYTYFDYLKGRVMKVDLSKNAFDPWLYDRDNGEGSAEFAIRQLD